MNTHTQEHKKSQSQRILEEHLEDLIARYPRLEGIRRNIGEAAELLLKAAVEKKKVLICGNGGSAADADHIVGELMKSFRKPRTIDESLEEKLLSIDDSLGKEIAGSLQQGIPALSLTQHTALNSAYSNDVNPVMGFAQQVSVLGNPGDLLWALTTSGNSKNVVAAALTARVRGMRVLGMTGENGGWLKRYADVCVQVPEQETYKVQELHLPVYHMLCMVLEDSLW